MDLEFLIPITLFGSMFGLGYMHFKTRNSERLALIEKGADTSIFNDKDKNMGMTLKIGMLLIGIAIGIFVGGLLDEFTKMGEQGYFSMIFLFGGIGLVFNDFIERKRAKEDTVKQ